MRILSLCLLMACFACGTDDGSSETDDSATADTTETTTDTTDDTTTETETSTDGDTTTDTTDETTTDDSTETETSDDTETSEPDTTEPDTETETETETEPDTDPDSVEAPDGSSATSCGHESQGLEPVDCTAHGDVNAFCVFSNHCACSVDDGFECETESEWGGTQECAPGSTCVPVTED